MKKSKNNILLAISIFFSVHSYSQSISSALDKGILQEMVNTLIDTTDIPGIHLAIVSMDGIEQHVFAGKKVVNLDMKMEETDLMHLGSNTKSMTAFVAAAIVERGLISWDTKFFDLFPELKDKANKGYYEITLENLLEHRAFVAAYTEDEEFDLLPKVIKGPILGQRINWFKEILLIKPQEINENQEYNYSNAGYSMAAAMLEKVTGLEYEEIMEAYLFTPLNIEGQFGWPENHGEDQPKGHYLQDGENTVSALREDENYHIGRMIAPAGDVCLNLADYSKYLQANLLGLNGYHATISNESYRKIHELRSETEYALGWGVAEIQLGNDQYTISTHDGSGGTYLCKTILIPGLDLGITIMINSAEDDHDLAIKRLRNSILRTILQKQ